MEEFSPVGVLHKSFTQWSKTARLVTAQFKADVLMAVILTDIVLGISQHIA